ncbi:MAG: hypothetical protein JO187_08030 [Acidobacteria bacterium]|nr:hypothetical protein [Acidobacteriota bacterium]
MPKAQKKDHPLQGWKEISEFLGQSTATVQHWAKSGMPVSRQGRYVTASREELAGWLGRESGTRQPVHIATGDDIDMLADLKRGVAEARSRRKIHRVK